MANIDRVKLPDNSEYDLQVKVNGATNGNVAVMDSSGNVADGGRPLSDLDTWSKYGAKNLIRNIMNTTTVNGVKFTVNADGSVTTSQSATDNIYRPYADFYLPAGDYILTGSPSGSSSNTHYSYVRNEDTTEQYYDYDGSGASFSLAADSHVKVYIAYKSGQTANETFYPMIRDASVVDATFKPIAETNRELTVGKADTSTLAPTEDGATASRAYATGEYFLRGGKLCICKTDIASGGSFTLNTNYIESPNLCYELRNKRIVRAREVIYETGVSGYGSEKVMCIEFSDGSILVNGAMKVSATYTSSGTSHLLFTLPSGITFPHSSSQRWAIFNEFLSGNSAIPILFGSPGNTAKAWGSAVTVADLQNKNFIVNFSW